MTRYTNFQKNATPPRRFWSLALMGIVLMGAVSTQATEALAQRSRPLPPQINQPHSRPGRPSIARRLPVIVSQRVRRDLAQRLNVSPRAFRVVSFRQETWPDSCLGLAAANERCAMALVEGWEVELTDGQQNWVYRTDRRADIIRLATQDQSQLPPEIVDRLFATIAPQLRVPASSLKVTEVKPAVWDGCMGIYAPDQVCTRIAISGWQVIVAGDTHSWVYHVSEDGSRIVQNTTASGSREVFVSFIPEVPGSTPQPTPNQPTPNNPAVFRFSESGGLAGIVSETVLLADGTVYRRVWQPNAPQTSDPVIEKRLTPQQVQQFQQLLRTQRFPNLNGLRYLTDAALADYPTTQLQAMGSTVEYIDLEQDNLPPALQAVIQAWQRL